MVPLSVPPAARGKAALRLNITKLQKALSDNVRQQESVHEHSLLTAVYGASPGYVPNQPTFARVFAVPSQFPNKNRLVSREQFAEITSTAIVEDSQVDIDVSAFAFMHVRFALHIRMHFNSQHHP